MTTDLFVSTYNRQPVEGELILHEGQMWLYDQGAWKTVPQASNPELIV